MKRDWKNPSLDVLNISMTMNGQRWRGGHDGGGGCKKDDRKI
ncbi:paeninodin family lasso peptide [Halobacillus sp. A1]|nr:paeninodin family lasso peptide [Halobacillus sp. A1]MCP3030038.1 paeninodin family lasso peptide [Halobacillus sp. A1]